ncbi:beta-galactosidase [Microbacterium protaetiae]|uniref:Beta-galactosidase n=1 Tax=Microbacterium protaetiae TaxID=2509458 RepID=A0A4P6EAF1_9MICO|nr:beta-galactosidase [Microbacterium protaetiae]QAY59100.1 beta-galactosidase [Microbacterium protaetiae]
MPTAAEAAHALTVTDRALRRGDAAWIPISGEIHFSRVPRHRWRERLRQLTANGVTVASSYVLWLHHVAERGHPRFDGNLDVAAFIDECADAGLQVALRIGPWAHAEARNGGFPDWVQRTPVAHRTDDPGYLALVREWFAQLAEALDGRARPGGPVLAIQLENELYDRPDHLRTLKRLAQEAGIAAPLWTATAWGGAELPDGEVFPLWGGYADGFWVDPDDGWQPNFRAHFLPSHQWDDPGVGIDVRRAQGFGSTASAGLAGFPPATCELGGGMAAAYHRRPVLAARDIAALAHVKIGNGSAWQGYYMYAGGVNPGPGLQESHDTGYPNDLPQLGYDFHAPIAQSGDLAASAGLLRMQHAFLDAFGPLLGDMSSTLPDTRPDGVDDRTTLRWALRSDGASGFVVVSHHQPYSQLADVPEVRLRVELDEATVDFPAMTVPAGTLARWPVRLPLGDAIVDWATASALTVIPGRRPTLVLVEDAGIPARISIDGVTHPLTPGRKTRVFGSLAVLTLPHDAQPWVQPCAGGQRRLLLSSAELAWDGTGCLFARGGDGIEAYEAGEWRMLRAGRGADPVEELAAQPLREPGIVPPDYGLRGRRHSAPTAARFESLAGVWTLSIPAAAFEADAVIDIDWAGDVAQLRVNDRIVDDRFWDGTRWSVAVREVGIGPGDRVTVHILPLSPDATTWLPAAAHRQRGPAQLVELRGATLRRRGAWEQVPAG